MLTRHDFGRIFNVSGKRLSCPLHPSPTLSPITLLFVGRDLRSSGEVKSPKNEDLAAVAYAFNASTRRQADLSSRTARGFIEKPYLGKKKKMNQWSQEHNYFQSPSIHQLPEQPEIPWHLIQPPAQVPSSFNNHSRATVRQPHPSTSPSPDHLPASVPLGKPKDATPHLHPAAALMQLGVEPDHVSVHGYAGLTAF